MITTDTLTDEMADDLKVKAENDGDHELAQECNYYLFGGASFSRTLIAEIRIVRAINDRANPRESECDFMPASAGAGHWREWHRGHGCDKDPDAKRGAK